MLLLKRNKADVLLFFFFSVKMSMSIRTSIQHVITGVDRVNDLKKVKYRAWLLVSTSAAAFCRNSAVLYIVHAFKLFRQYVLMNYKPSLAIQINGENMTRATTLMCRGESSNFSKPEVDGLKQQCSTVNNLTFDSANIRMSTFRRQTAEIESTRRHWHCFTLIAIIELKIHLFVFPRARCVRQGMKRHTSRIKLYECSWLVFLMFN